MGTGNNGSILASLARMLEMKKVKVLTFCFPVCLFHWRELLVKPVGNCPK